MKRLTPLLVILMIILLSTSASASIFDWINNAVTGRVTEGTEAIQIVNEQVKCVFLNLDTEQKCYTSDGKFACSGAGSCVADVSGETGAKLEWKSSCSGYSYYTLVDGTNDNAEFKCELATPIPIPTPTPTPELVKEQVKCTFLNSNSEQKCYTDDGKFACSGTGSCLIDVSGQQGQQLHWKNSCGSEAYTKIDGVDDSMEFNCEPRAIPAPTSTETIAVPAGDVYEEVTCDFAYSNALQQCYSEDKKFSCTGKDRCLAKIYGKKGERIIFKGTCKEGYSEILIDGVYGNVWFNCEQAQRQTPLSEPIAIPAETPREASASTSTRDRVKLHYFYWEKECPLCESEKSFLEKLKLKYSQVEYDAYSVDDSTKTSTYSYFVISNLKQGMPTIFFDDKIWIGYDNNIAAEIENKVSSCLEKGCSLTPAVPATATAQATQTSAVSSTPIQEVPSTAPASDTAKEQVECIFWNSDVLQNPHTARPEECYSNKFGCKWTGEVVEKDSNEGRIRYAYCIAEVSGERGAQLVWKSSCGGYAYTKMDGNNEAAEFKCTPSSEVKAEQISGKGFKRAYWQCYDGAEQKMVASEDASCKFSEQWQKEAEEFCKGHCYADGSKCGVNSFSVMDECYIEAGKEGVIFAVPEKPKGGKKFAMPPSSNIGSIMVVYFYSDACKHCLGMNEELDKVSKELNIDIKRINVINEPEIVESYGIKGVPAVLILKYYSDGIKEYLRHGRADSTAIINWITKPEIEVQEKPAEIEKLKEEIRVICKDSCPFEGKCYPFGYRKTGKYCSDEGAFKEQLKEDSVCDNNFECSTNVCVDGKCMSSGVIQKFIGWFKKLFGLVGGEEAKEDIAEIVDCGTSTECLENAFKECKPAKMSQSQGPISEMVIIGLEGKKCVLKMTGSTEMTGGAESMTCKFENYALGMKNVGPESIEQYCTGKLTYWLAAPPKMRSLGEAPASASETKPSTEIQPQKTEQIKKENIQEPIAKETISKEVKVPAQTETLNAISACEKIRETGLKYKCKAMLKKDFSDCEMVDEPATAYCYADVALVTGDSAICEKIKDLGHRGACEALVERVPAKCSEWIYADYCYRDVAVLIGDTSICDQIKYEGGKMTCKAVILKDVSLCQNTDTEDCYQKIALLTGDETVCDELSKIQITGERPIAIHNLDEEVSKCIKMAKKEITGCLFKSGSGTDCDLIPAMAKNPSLCENLQSDYPGFAERDRCYFYAAIRLADLLPPQLAVLRN